MQDAVRHNLQHTVHRTIYLQEMMEAKLDATFRRIAARLLPHKAYCAVVCKAYVHTSLHTAAAATQSLYMDADAQMVRSRLGGCVVWRAARHSAWCVAFCLVYACCMAHLLLHVVGMTHALQQRLGS